MQLKALYQRLFNYIFEHRREAQDLEPRVVHTHLLTVLTTGALMWGYAFLAIFTISHPAPGIVGVVMSIIHNLSPLAYRYTNKPLIAASILLASGMAHQGTFSYFTGGFYSNIIIWFGVLPFLGAIIAGKRGAILWCFICVAVTGIGCVLKINGHEFPMLITPTGYFIAQCFIAFGWIFLSSILSYAYLAQEEATTRDRMEKKESIENLFRILCHDIGNPLALLQMGMEQVSQGPVEKRERALEISQRAVTSLVELTQNVRRMYALREGKIMIDCIPMSLNAAMDQVQFLFQGPLASKKVKLNYNTQEHIDIVVLVDPISFIHQVIGNILSNAIKFSEAGQEITIFAEKTKDGYVQLCIKDQGVGMPAYIREKLFDVHARTSRPGTSGERGTGFGMHLMKTFVEKYGGSVDVESKEQDQADHGTTFYITLRGNYS